MQTLNIILRFRAMLLWAVAFLLLVLIVCAISAAPQEQWNFGAAGTWNDARLAWVAAWLRGYPLYPSESSGIITGNIYPPLGALAFAPAAMFGDPLLAVIVGSMLSLLMGLSPGVGALILYSRGLQKSPEAAKMILLGSVLYLGLLIITDATRYTLFAIHVDAPAIALMLWGVIFYAIWWATGAPSSIAVSAFFLSSVVWAKQVGVSLPFTFLIVTYFIGGLRPALIFSAWSLGTLAFWLLVLTPIVVDWRAFLFNVWTVNTGYPWVGPGQVVGDEMIERTRLYVAQSVKFLKSHWLLYLTMFALALALNVCAKQSGDKSLRLSFTLGVSSLIAGVAMLPFAWLGLVRLGGDVNSAAYSVQPVLFGLVIGSLGLAEVTKKAGVQWNVIAQSVICAWLCLIFIAALPNRSILHYPLNITSSPMLTVYKESKSDKVWFPGFPLSSLLSTGHLYHFSRGIFDRYLAGKSVSKAQILEGVPTPPFKLKYLENSTTNANPMSWLLGLSDGKKTGPWVEIIVQDLPRPIRGRR
jgi:hypothetical protein